LLEQVGGVHAPPLQVPLQHSVPVVQDFALARQAVQ